MAKKGRRSSGCLLAIVAIVGIGVAILNRDDKPTNRGTEARDQDAKERMPESKPAPGNPNTLAQAPTSAPAVPAPVASPPAPPDPKPQLTPLQIRYMFLARAYLFSAKEQGKAPPILRLEGGDCVVGKLPGRFRILQILSGASFLGYKVDADGLPQHSVFVEGISTVGEVDGKLIGFADDTVFQHKGTKSYETILGAVRTVYAVEALDSTVFEWALARVKVEQQAREIAQEEERKAKLAAAKMELADITARLRKLESDHSKTAQYVSLQTQLRMYRPNASIPRIGELVRDIEAKLKALGPVLDAEVKAYIDGRADLTRRQREAMMRVNGLGR